MINSDLIEGFSRLDREEKVKLITAIVGDDQELHAAFDNHLHRIEKVQKQYQEFSENTLSNYFLPYGIAPNFLVDGKVFHVPMVTEESSVVAAASSAAKFWASRGGFKCEIGETIKTGQVHFKWAGDYQALSTFFSSSKEQVLKSTESITANMERRGGGIKNMNLIHKPEIFEDYYQINVEFDTVDSMGANFINTCLEQIAHTWKELLEGDTGFGKRIPCTIIMSILSNYTPNCLVKCTVSEKIENMGYAKSFLSNSNFCETFVQAMQIAESDINRSVTHNKGIFNGVDAVILATGNDFRAVEANGHAYAARSGSYRSLSKAWLENNRFFMELEMPMAIGSVGGLTHVHPLAKKSLKILHEPGANQLMKITAAVGLANNFSAVRSLTTVGIQQGHMKLHITNILSQLHANEEEKVKVTEWFSNKTVTYHDVENFLLNLRN